MTKSLKRWDEFIAVMCVESRGKPGAVASAEAGAEAGDFAVLVQLRFVQAIAFPILTPALSPRPTRGEGGAVGGELTLGKLTAAGRSSLSPSEGERAGVRGEAVRLT